MGIGLCKSDRPTRFRTCNQVCYTSPGHIHVLDHPDGRSLCQRLKVMCAKYVLVRRGSRHGYYLVTYVRLCGYHEPYSVRRLVLLPVAQSDEYYRRHRGAGMHFTFLNKHFSDERSPHWVCGDNSWPACLHKTCRSSAAFPWPPIRVSLPSASAH